MLSGNSRPAEIPEGPHIWRFPEIRGTFLGVPIIRTIVFWGLYWGSPILGKYRINIRELGPIIPIVW